jgi:hypothetical protein
MFRFEHNVDMFVRTFALLSQKLLNLGSVLTRRVRFNVWTAVEGTIPGSY